MKKTSIVFTIAFTLIGTAPLSASYWSEIQEYLPQCGDFVPSCGNKVEELPPTAVEQTVVEEVAVNETTHQEQAVKEPVVEVVTEGLDAAKGMQNLMSALKKNPFVVSGAHVIAAERGAFKLIQSLAVYAKSKDVLVAFKPVQVAGVKFFKKPNLGAKSYFSSLENFSKASLKLDEAFVLNELKVIVQQMQSKKVNAHVVFGHLCALYALIEGQDEKFALSIKSVIAKFSRCKSKPKQVAALAPSLHNMLKEAEKRG